MQAGRYPYAAVTDSQKGTDMIRQATITMAAGALTAGVLSALAPAAAAQATTHRPDTIFSQCQYTVVVDRAAVYADADVDSRVVEWEPQGATGYAPDGYLVGDGANFESVFAGYVKLSDLQKHDCIY
ncbi:hypothetical protein NUM_64510 [Actinocatenispora comari]|uniref:Uncharacterized protein n=2 Tax=Actinocatenispora comari TaxID=2807577 RepID=A0A8J4AK19_9ACTN|nr:hypothetical protein NUM_64510 [Actinocatenispora comari]